MGVFIEISDDVQPAVLQPAQPFVPQAWVPQNAASAVPVPTGIVVTPIADGAVITWNETPKGVETIVQTSSDGPTWVTVDRTPDSTSTIGLTESSQVRIINAVEGIQSAPSAVVVATPIEAASAADVAQAQTDATEALAKTADHTQLLIDQQQAIDAEIADRLAGDLAAVQAAAQDATNKANAAAAAANARADALQAQLNDFTGQADEWVMGQAYPKGDFVRSGNKLYRAIQDAPGNIPLADTDYWWKLGEYSSVGDAVAKNLEWTETLANEQGAHTQRLNGLDAKNLTQDTEISQRATNAQLDTVRTTANAAKGLADTHTSQIATLQASQQGNSESIAAHNNRLSEAETHINTLTGDVSGLSQTVQTQGVTLGGKADSSYVDQVKNTVDQQGGVLSNHGESLQSLNATVFDPVHGVTAQGAVINQSTIDIKALKKSAPNPITNPSGELGTQGWSEVNGTTNFSVTANNEGSHFLILGVNSIQGRQYEWTLPYTAGAGDVFGFAVDGVAAGVNSGVGKINITAYNASGGYLGESTFTALPNESWAKTVNRFAVPANAKKIVGRIYADSSPNMYGLAWRNAQFAKLDTITSEMPAFNTNGTVKATAQSLNAVELRLPLGGGQVAEASVVQQALVDISALENPVANPIANPGGELGTQGWIDAAFIPNLSVDKNADGSFLVVNNINNTAARYYEWELPFVYPSGAVFGFAVDGVVIGKTSGSFVIDIIAVDSSGNVLMDSGGTQLPTYGWDRVVNKITLPANTKKLWGRVVAEGGANASAMAWRNAQFAQLKSINDSMPAFNTAGTLSRSLASYTLSVRADDIITGFESKVSGGKSSFSILASVFRVISATTGLGMEWLDGYLRIWKGSAQLIIGHTFGANQDLIFYYGANVGAANASKGNATIWFDTVGNAYFGGSLSAGTRKNAAQSTQQSATASVETGNFGTGGNAKVVVCSFSAGGTTAQIGNTGTGSLAMQATVVLERSYGGGAWTQIGSFTANGQYVRTYNSGDNLTEHQADCSGAITVTDNMAGTGTFNYRARIASSSNVPVIMPNSAYQQNLSVISTEQ